MQMMVVAGDVAMTMGTSIPRSVLKNPAVGRLLPNVQARIVDGIQTIRGKKNVGYTLHTVIDRRDFGIVFAKMLDNNLFAGNEVTIDIETAAVEK